MVPADLYHQRILQDGAAGGDTAAGAVFHGLAEGADDTGAFRIAGDCALSVYVKEFHKRPDGRGRERITREEPMDSEKWRRQYAVFADAA